MSAALGMYVATPEWRWQYPSPEGLPMNGDWEVAKRLIRERDQAKRIAGDTSIAPACIECGTALVVADGRGRRRYCTVRCRTRRANRAQLLANPQAEQTAKRRATGYWCRWQVAQKSAALAAYGGAVCACCGDTHLEFLSIDHIDGGGRRHRAEIRTSLYRWLRLNNYPPGFRVLCMNCNFASRFGRQCPHQEEKRP